MHYCKEELLLIHSLRDAPNSFQKLSTNYCRYLYNPLSHTVLPSKSQYVLFYVSVEIYAGDGRSSVSTSGVPKIPVKDVRQAQDRGENILLEHADQEAGISLI